MLCEGSRVVAWRNDYLPDEWYFYKLQDLRRKMRAQRGALVGRHFVKDVGYEACLLGQLSLNKQKVEGGPGEGNVRS